MADEQEVAGGQGGLEHFAPRAGQTSDTRMIARAVRERWPIPAGARSAIVGKMLTIIANKDKAASNREIVSAVKCILSADKLNIEQEERDNPTVQQHEHVHQLGTVERLDAALERLKAEARHRGLIIDSATNSAS